VLPEVRLTRVLEWAREHFAELEVTEKIRDDVRERKKKKKMKEN